MGSQTPGKDDIKQEYEDNENSFNMDAKPSTARDLSSDLDDDFPICEPSEAKRQPSSASVKLQRHFIAPAKDSKNVIEIKHDHNVHLPLLLRKNWRKKANPTTATSSTSATKKVSSKMNGRNAIHRSTSPSGGPPSKIRRPNA